MRKYKKSSCEIVDAFAILTRQGVALLSDDAKVTPAEDSYLYNLNMTLIERSKKTWEENQVQVQKMDSV